MVTGKVTILLLKLYILKFFDFPLIAIIPQVSLAEAGSRSLDLGTLMSPINQVNIWAASMCDQARVFSLPWFSFSTGAQLEGITKRSAFTDRLE
jgi:hypothetical protein